VTTHEKKRSAMLRVAARKSDRDPHTGALRTCVHVLGSLALLVYAGMAALSYVQAPALWQYEEAPQAKAFFQALASQLQPVLPWVSMWLAENSLFGSAGAIVLSVWAQLVAATAIVMVLVLTLLRRGDRADPGLPRLLLIWSFAFAAVCAFAFPVFTQDFWLSAAWGRMVAGGVNPYHTLFTPEWLTGLPLDHFPMAMSYGPLWALISAAVMLVAGSNLLATAILFKGVLAAAWIATLYLVYKMTAHRSLRERCLAIVVLGWTPAGVGQSLAEGHNDIAMVVLMLLWLFLLLRGRQQAPIALVAASLCKYVTAPLLAIDFIHAVRLQRLGWGQSAARLAASAILALGGMAIFYRSSHFFDGVRLVGSWHFLQPGEAVWAIELMLGVSLQPFSIAAEAAFPGFAAYLLWKAWVDPSSERTLQAVIGLMAAILFTVVSHLWAWYAIWGLALAALLPTWWLSRFIIGVAILAPFTLAAWWVEPFPHHQEIAALALYAGALAWTAITRPRTVAPAGSIVAALPAITPPMPVASTALRLERTGTHG
jgi:alpha-1,6-mannosyltransferase